MAFLSEDYSFILIKHFLYVAPTPRKSMNNMLVLVSLSPCIDKLVILLVANDSDAETSDEFESE